MKTAVCFFVHLFDYSWFCFTPRLNVAGALLGEAFATGRWAGCGMYPGNVLYEKCVRPMKT